MDNIGKLLIILQKAHRAAIAERLSEIKLYPGQDGLLYHLSLNDGLTMTVLIDKMKIRLPTLFTMVNRMETAGLIKKDKDKTDKRTSRIFLTEKGKEQLTKLSKIWQDIEKKLLDGFNPDDIQATKMVLNKLITNLGSNSDFI